MEPVSARRSLDMGFADGLSTGLRSVKTDATVDLSYRSPFPLPRQIRGNSPDEAHRSGARMRLARAGSRRYNGDDL